MSEPSGTPNRWTRVEELFHAALEQAPAGRGAFLSNVCGADSDLRREVESLLGHHGEDYSLLEQPALAHAGHSLEPEPTAGPAWSLGTMIGPYRIEGPLGAGGMGEVFRARDTRLGRVVALKTLAPAVARNRSYLDRFRREARTLASLNHPNVASLYGIEEYDGGFALVMELVEGETLVKRQGALPIDTALDYARQIVAGMEAAHDKGIIHRDLKPANIKVTPEGTVKILDFGLAKPAESPASATSGANPSASPTFSLAMTEKGMILGTAAYMSPEQARGEAVDKRADIWAFGVILYELLTGRMLFGDTKNVSDSLAAVLTREPDFGALPSRTPPGVRRLLEHCLRKDPKQRLRDIGDARLLLDEPGPTAAPTAARQWGLGWVVAVSLAIALAALGWLHFREKPAAAAPTVRFHAPPGTLSPDGRYLAYIARGRLLLHSFESGEARDLTAGDPGTTFWSPDSRFIGYLFDRKLRRIAAAGGPPQSVADIRNARYWGCGAWNRDDVIIFGDRQVGIFRVPATGGAAVQLTALEAARHENSQFCPSFLPDGRHFVYVRTSTDAGKSAIYLGSIEARPEQQSSQPLAVSNSQPVYAPSADPDTGYLLFVREGTLLAQSFDNRRMELQGRAIPIAEQVDDATRGAVFVAFSASANDVLAFPRSGSAASQITWYDRTGKVIGTIGEPGYYGAHALSPDGTRLAVSKNSGVADASNLWLLDLTRDGASTRLTFSPQRDGNPVWSPDGSQVIFGSNRDGPYNLYRKAVNGLKDEELLVRSGEDKTPMSWSRDGRFLLYNVFDEKTNNDLWVLPLEHDAKPVPFLNSTFNENQGHFSPDGKWVAYHADESGQSEIYVRPFAMNSTGTAVEAGAKMPISNGYGMDPRWRADGRELYYQTRDGKIMVVEVATHPVFHAGKPQPLGISTVRGWESAAGNRFLSVSTKDGGPQFTVMLNWQAGLRK